MVANAKRSAAIRDPVLAGSDQIESCGRANCDVLGSTEQANRSQSQGNRIFRWPLNVKACCWQQRNFCGSGAMREQVRATFRTNAVPGRGASITTSKASLILQRRRSAKFPRKCEMMLLICLIASYRV